MTYNYSDLINAYKELGIKQGDVIYVTGNLGMLGRSRVSKESTLRIHVNALLDAVDVVGEKGTVVFPTHSFSLVGADTPFDPENTPSESGPLTEALRQIADDRQMHPYASVSAIGKDATRICHHTSRHVYGEHSPMQRMIN